jgi:hypothetical protein
MLIVSLLTAVTSVQAITYIVPTDRDLVKRSKAIVVATAVDSHSELRDGGRLVTVATLQVERVLKGAVGEKVQLVELGGAIGNRVTMITGSPRYEVGKRYLVFLRTNSLGEWMTYGFALGKFEFVSDLQNRDLLTRGDSDERIFGLDEADGSLHVEHRRGAPEFLSFVESRVESEAPAREDYFVDQSAVIFTSLPEFRPRASAFIPHTESTRPDYMLDCGGGMPCRWQSPSAAFVYCCSAQTGGTGLDGPSGSSSAMAAWNAAGAGVAYSLTGQDLSATGGLSHPDGKDGILFNDPDNIIGNSGAVAVGGISNASGIYGTCSPTPCPPDLGDGFKYFNTIEVDVVTGKNIPSFVGQSLYIQLLTHELGHTLGFRHANGTSSSTSPPPSCQAPSPCAAIGQAIMASVLPSGNSIGSLGPWDQEAVQTGYGSGPVCNAPSITTQPQSQSIASGSQANLSVVASGTATLTYQWYSGGSPSTGTIVNGATSATFHPSPVVTTSYSVRVSNSCNGVQNADSNTVTVTVTCTSPSAASGPTATPSSITAGSSSTLSVVAGGSGPFTYQWYIGTSSGDTVHSTLISGATGSSTSVSPPLGTTDYWVRINGQCGTFDTPIVQVTVTACAPPNITGQPADQQITAGGSATLNVSATGTALTYQWFIGNPDDQSNPVSAPSANSFVFVSPSATTTYWVRVTGQCGFANSNAVTVTVTPTCVGAAIGTQPASATIAQGSSKTLAVVATGTSPITYQWYTGSSGDFSSAIQNATATQVTVTPGATTSYWVHVSNSCGSANSNTATITVSTCTPPSITTQPANVSAPITTSATLHVVAAGTGPQHYQWYEGAKGNTTKTVGIDSATFVTGAVSANKTYWVRVTGCNNATADSNAATVTATAPPRRRAVRP